MYIVDSGSPLARYSQSCLLPLDRTTGIKSTAPPSADERPERNDTARRNPLHFSVLRECCSDNEGCCAPWTALCEGDSPASSRRSRTELVGDDGTELVDENGPCILAADVGRQSAASTVARRSARFAVRLAPLRHRPHAVKFAVSRPALLSPSSKQLAWPCAASIALHVWALSRLPRGAREGLKEHRRNFTSRLGRAQIRKVLCSSITAPIPGHVNQKALLQCKKHFFLSEGNFQRLLPGPGRGQ